MTRRRAPQGSTGDYGWRAPLTNSIFRSTAASCNLDGDAAGALPLAGDAARGHHLDLGRAGRDLVKRAQKIAATMEEQSLAVLSPAERALLVELLAKVGLRAPG